MMRMPDLNCRCNGERLHVDFSLHESANRNLAALPCSPAHNIIKA